jgi:hypothetical protein
MAITIDQLMDAINSAAGGAGTTAPRAEDTTKLSARLKLMEREEELLRRKRDAMDATDDSLKGLIKREEAELAVRKKMEEQALIELKLLRERDPLNTAAIEAQKELIKELEGEVDTREQSIITQKKESEELDKNTAAREKNLASIDSVAGSMSGLVAIYGKHQMLSTDRIKSLYKSFKAHGLLNMAVGAGIGIITGFIDTMIAFTFAVDEGRSSIMKTTGVSREFATSITADAQAMSYYGVSVSDMAETVGALIPTFTDFTRLSDSQAASVRETGDLLKKTGVSGQTYGQSLQIMTKAMGMGTEGATAMNREFNSLATAIGVTPQQMAEDFAGVGGSLAKLGTDGPAAFKRLAIASKSTGLSIEKLLRVTDKFDTFEGAATQAGLLNAALGGNFVNAMDLMMATDPAERFGMIQDAILNTGLSFDEMDYYQRKFYAEAAGLEDVNDLALLMSGSLDEMSSSAKKSSDEIHKLQKRTKAMQSIQEKFKTLMMSMIPVIEPLINQLHGLIDNYTRNDKKIAELQDTFKSFGRAIMFVVENLELFIKGLLVITGGVILAKLALFVKALFGFGTAAPVVASGASAAVGPLLAFGAAILLAGAGIGLATAGIASMAAAFALLNPEQLTALNEAIGGLLYTFLAFGIGLLALAAAGSAAIGPLMAFGGAIALIGLGIAMPAAAIGYMAEGIASMLDAIDPTKLTALTGFIAKMALGSVGVAATVSGMVSIAGAINQIGNALNSLPFATLEMLSNLPTGYALQESGFLSSPAVEHSGVSAGPTAGGAALMDAINQVSPEKMAAAAVVVSIATTQATTMRDPFAPIGSQQNASPVDVNVKVYVDGVVTKAVAEVDKRLKNLATEI